MNTSRHLQFAVLAATAAVALAGAAMLATSAPKVEIVQLERVVIVGKRSPAETTVAQLPRVVITGRSTAANAELAEASLLKAQII